MPEELSSSVFKLRTCSYICKGLNVAFSVTPTIQHTVLNSGFKVRCMQFLPVG
jgi:hypothetical protein